MERMGINWNNIIIHTIEICEEGHECIDHNLVSLARFFAPLCYGALGILGRDDGGTQLPFQELKQFAGQYRRLIPNLQSDQIEVKNRYFRLYRTSSSSIVHKFYSIFETKNAGNSRCCLVLLANFKCYQSPLAVLSNRVLKYIHENIIQLVP